MTGRTKGILIGVFVLIVPAVLMLVINVYMHVLHPELLARGTTATITARDESPDRLVFHFTVDDPKAVSVIKRMKGDDLSYTVTSKEDDFKDWQGLNVGSRFCITYTDAEIQNFVAKCAAAKPQPQ